MGAIHRDRRYVLASKRLRDIANATPSAICWRCGHTLTEHDGNPRWQAGHTVDGSVTWALWPHVSTPPPTGDWLAAEVSTCNASAGATYGNRTRSTGYTWP